MWSDRRLARRAACGDQDAFAAIFRRYEQDLFRYCVAIVGDRQDAQDALQNTMVKALRALPGERREIDLKPWLYRVAHNESIELRRRSRPHEPLVEELSAPVASLEETAAERGRLREVLADIATLPDRHRGALVMRELGGLDFDQIGTALDTSPAAARQVLYEARRGLQQMREGREMRCDDVTMLLSDGDGRVARRRDVRAHLRDCQECEAFAEGIRERSATLAGIAPLPAVAAAAIAKSALAGGGGAAAGAAGSTAAGTSGATLAGGAAAKVASTGAILKSTAAIVAVVGAGAVGVEQGHLFRGGGASGGETHAAAAVSGAEPGGSSTGKTREPETSLRPAAAIAPSQDSAMSLAERAGPQAAKTHVEPALPARSQGGTAESTRPTTATQPEGAAPPPPTNEGAAAEPTTESSAPVTVPAAKAEARPHPEHPARPENHGQSTGPEEAERPVKTERPERPERPEKAERPEGPERTEAPTNPTHPSHPPHPTQPTTAGDAEEAPAPDPGESAESEAEAEPEPSPEEAAGPEVVSHPTRPTEPPGQAKK